MAVLPLNKKLHSEKAEEIYKMLASEFDVVYDETQNIGRRYRRQDQIGTYFAVTIDNDSLENDTVTLRFRDSMEQITLKVEDLEDYIRKALKY